MLQTISNNNKDLTINSVIQCNEDNNSPHWFESKSIIGKYELSKQYASICQQHRQQKKWVLFINPDESSLEQLSTIHGVDISKVLCVNVKVKQGSTKQEETLINLNIEQIKNVLCRGNCSAVILSNAMLKQDEIVELNTCAIQGETQCIVLKTVTKSIDKKQNFKLH